MSGAKGRYGDERKDQRNPKLTNPRYNTTKKKSSTIEDTPASVRKKEVPITSLGSSSQQANPNTMNVLGHGISQPASAKAAYASKTYFDIGASHTKSGEFKAETCADPKPFSDGILKISGRKKLYCVQCSLIYNESVRRPKSLLCGHTVCEACLQVLFLRAPRCPICQTTIKSKNIEDFITDYIVFARISLLDSTSPKSVVKTYPNKTEAEVNLLNIRPSGEEKRKKENQMSTSVPTSQMSERSYDMITVPETEERLESVITGVKSKMPHRATKPTEERFEGQITGVKSKMPHRATRPAEERLEGEIIVDKSKTLLRATKVLDTKDNTITMKENYRRNSIPNDFCPSKIQRAAMVCGDCSIFYDHSARLPRILPCGHSVCTSCLRFLIKHDPSCPKCQESFKKIKHVTDAVVNKTLCELISAEEASFVDVEEKQTCEDKLYPRVSGAEKPVVTANSIDIHESHPQYSTGKNNSDDILIIKKASPHKSRCLEVGVSPTSHCASCQKWVCDECGNIDHPQQKGCFLIPKREALLQMKEAYVNDVRVTGESVEDALEALEIYQEHLEAFSTTMQAAFECIGKEKERIKMITKRGQERKREMKAAVSGFSSAQNLPKALALLQKVNDLSIGTQQWITTDAVETLDCRRIIETVKEILLSSVYMMKMADPKKNAVLLLVASQKVFDVTLLSRMTVQEKYLFVHCLEKMDTVPKGTRAIPFLSIKACLNSSSPLVFLDIGWNGKVAGRLIIRLLGETYRGRQFLMLCTGESGSSFCNTHFHSVSHKGLPGEHIWGGDYENGNGSGGKSFLGMSEKKLALPAGKSMPIKAGLLAGNYIETSPSSLFRIYTKDEVKLDKDCKHFDRESVELNDHSAFGMVELGLHILDSAVKQKSIMDVIIYSCGIIIDA